MDVPNAATAQGNVASDNSPLQNMTWFAGDIDGDGLADLYDVYEGSQAGATNAIAVDVHFNTGACNADSCNTTAAFVNYPQLGKPLILGPWHAGAQWVTGDFDFNGTPDLAEAYGDSVMPGFIDIDVILSSCNPANGAGDGVFAGGACPRLFGLTDTVLTIQRYATRQQGWWTTQKWFAGDFNSDGFADLGLAFDDFNLTDLDVHLIQ